MLYYKIKENGLDFAHYRFEQDCLETDIVTAQQLEKDKSLVIVKEGEIVLNPDYEQEQAQKREEAFYKDFIEVENFGYLRKKPKGYTNIIEAFNSIFNLVSVMGSLPKDLVTIYAKPDFTKKEQCSDTWLTQNSFMNTSMDAYQFNSLYSRLLETYNLQEHLN